MVGGARWSTRTAEAHRPPSRARGPCQEGGPTRVPPHPPPRTGTEAEPQPPCAERRQLHSAHWLPREVTTARDTSYPPPRSATSSAGLNPFTPVLPTLPHPHRHLGAWRATAPSDETQVNTETAPAPPAGPPAAGTARDLMWKTGCTRTVRLLTSPQTSAA